MADRMQDLFEEIVTTLRADMKRQGSSVDPLHYVEEEVQRWKAARGSDDGIWFSLILQMLRFGFGNYAFTYDRQPLLQEHLANFEALADLDEKGKRKLAEVEGLELNVQRVRSVAKNARTMRTLQRDFGSVVEFLASFESEQDLAAGVEEMFSYIKDEGAVEFTREMGWKTPGSSPAVRRVLSRMRELVDGSIDMPGIRAAIAAMAAATGRDEETIDFLLQLFAAGDTRIGLAPICDVNFACYRCRVSDRQCAERRYEFGTGREIVHEERE